MWQYTLGRVLWVFATLILVAQIMKVMLKLGGDFFLSLFALLGLVVGVIMECVGIEILIDKIKE